MPGDARMSEWGNPAGAEPAIRPEGRRPTRGTETSKYPEEKKANAIARVAASESAAAQTGPVATRAPGLKGRRRKPRRKARGSGWKAAPERVTGPYPKARSAARRTLSKAGHEESCPNPRGPPRKAKYYRETDSEPVPRGKGEKNPEQGSEIDPEIARLQAVGAASLRECGDGVPFA